MQRENLTVLVLHWQDTVLPLSEDGSMTLAREEKTRAAPSQVQQKMRCARL